MAVTDVTGKSAKFVTAGESITGRRVISKIVWYGKDIAADDDIAFKNGAGGVLLEWAANTAKVGFDMDFSPPLFVDGFEVDVLDHGIVYVFFA
jgi:hypothetical protein